MHGCIDRVQKPLNLAFDERRRFAFGPRKSLRFDFPGRDSLGCLPEEKFPTFASGRQGSGATTLSDFRRQFHPNYIALYALAKAQQIDRSTPFRPRCKPLSITRPRRLAAIEQERPACLASKQARTSWQNQVTQAKGRLAQLERRFERVGEIAQMGLVERLRFGSVASTGGRYHANTSPCITSIPRVTSGGPKERRSWP